MKGRIFHLEDDPDWVDIIRRLLGTEYDLYQATSAEDAAQVFRELGRDGLKCDLAIIDISLLFGDPHDKRGLGFVDALEMTRILPGRNILILSAYTDIDDNTRVAFRDYDVVDVFDKGRFAKERSAFLKSVENVVQEAQESSP